MTNFGPHRRSGSLGRRKPLPGLRPGSQSRRSSPIRQGWDCARRGRGRVSRSASDKDAVRHPVFGLVDDERPPVLDLNPRRGELGAGRPDRRGPERLWTGCIGRGWSVIAPPISAITAGCRPMSQRPGPGRRVRPGVPVAWRGPDLALAARRGQLLGGGRGSGC